MIDMHFGAFLVLLILGLIAALVEHYVIRYRFLQGFDGFIWKWVVGWVGAWLGSPVLGNWWFRIAGVYVIPALIGAFAGAFLATALWKGLARSGMSIPKTT